MKESSASVRRRSILVVDDEENFLTLLKWFLAQYGYDVYTAVSVDEALDLTQTRVFNLALLDIKIGPSDGLFLLEQLIQHIPEIKVVMMTAYPTVSSIKQAFDRGASRYLTKPFDLQELTEVVKTLL